MEKEKDFKKIYKYKPSNPNDPKMPFLGSSSQTNENSQDFEPENKVEEEVKQPKNDLKPSDEDNIFLVEDLKQEKDKASGIIAKLRQNANLPSDNNGEKETLKEENDEEIKASNFVMPDPNSHLNILYNQSQQKKAELEKLNETKKVIKILRGDVRLKLTDKEIKVIVNTFKSKVVRITPKEVVLKNSKYGFEIYRNSTDKKYWVAAICFEELWNPKSVNYLNLWSGNSFVGYGFKTLEETIAKTNNLMTRGKTGNIMWKDFVINWDKDKNRFYTGSEPKQFTYNEYKQIIKWYKENKIWILVKQKNVKDVEDLMEENKAKRKAGERISPMALIQEKLLEPPRKVTYIFGYPICDPNYKGKDYVEPANKLYEIGFALTE